MLVRRREPFPREIVFVQNWFEELERLAPSENSNHRAVAASGDYRYLGGDEFAPDLGVGPDGANDTLAACHSPATAFVIVAELVQRAEETRANSIATNGLAAAEAYLVAPFTAHDVDRARDAIHDFPSFK